MAGESKPFAVICVFNKTLNKILLTNISFFRVTYQAKRMNRAKSKRILGKPSWLNTSQWEATNMLENTVPAFQGLSKNMLDKPEFW